MTTSLTEVELIVSPSWIITVNQDFQILENHSLIVKSGKILDILPQQDVAKKYTGKVLTLKGQALLPGLINTHNHAAMSLFRGYAEDQSLQQWLNESIWPAEGLWVSKEFVQDGTLLACAEMIKSGTTTFNDMYFFPDATSDIVATCKMRANISFPILEFPTVWANSADEYIDKGLALHDQLKHQPLISTSFGPHAPYTVSTPSFERISTLAEELDINIHMHLHENAQEVIDYQKANGGKSAIEHYAELGFLSPRLQAVHMTQLSEKEMELLHTFGVHLVHCPESNMKLASGICPVQQLLDKGINVALGTDGCASNNDLDLIGEMKSAGLLAKISSENAAALNAETLLRMATINGAKLLGIDALCGSLEIGKAADMVSIDLSELSCMPLYNPVSQIIYSASKSQVSHVWINGYCVLDNKQLTLIDEQEVLKKSLFWQAKIKQH